MKSLLDREELVFNPPELGCVLYLPGLPGGGSKIYDRSPYGNIGTITGATWVRLPSGLWVLSFDGADDFVDFGDCTYLRTNEVTVLFWVKPSAFTSAPVQYSLRANSSAYSGTTTLLSSSTNKFQFLVAEDDENWKLILTSNDALLTTRYYLLAGTYKSGEGRIYVNGVQQAETSSATGNIYYDGTDLRIGGEHDDTRDHFGTLALFRIYNRALSALEIQNSFNREKHLFGVW